MSKSRFAQLTEEFQRHTLRELLAKCTQEQQDRFNRWTKGGVAALPLDGLANAYGLLERTVAANERKDRGV